MQNPLANSRKVVNAINENKVVMKTKVPNLRGENEKHIVLTVSDSEGTLLRLVEYIKSVANRGHSFTVSVDPDDKEYHKDFYIDGDGADHIYDITVEEYHK